MMLIMSCVVGSHLVCISLMHKHTFDLCVLQTALTTLNKLCWFKKCQGYQLNLIHDSNYNLSSGCKMFELHFCAYCPM